MMIMAGKKGSGRKPTLPEAAPRACEWCGITFTPPRKRAKQRFCSRLCQRRWRCRPDANRELSRRTKWRRGGRLRWTGSTNGYVKLHGRHFHRVLAEIKLGRKLLPGESGPPHQWRQARQPRRKPRSVAFPGRTCTHPQRSAPQETRCIIHLNPLTASPRLRRRRRGPKVRGNSASSAPRSWGQAKPLTSRGRSAAR